MNRKPIIKSSEIYHIDPKALRSSKLEAFKREKNPYGAHTAYKHLPLAKRCAMFNALVERMRREGFKVACPIEVMLLRKDGVKDRIYQGHHRLAAAIILGLPLVPVRFLA